MSVLTYGPEHDWFAWHPVDTYDQGWKWLRTVRRRRECLRLHGVPAMRFWGYRMGPE